MSISIINAYKWALKINQRLMTIYAVGSAPQNIYVTKSNYSRKMELPEEISTKGREYIITLENLAKTSYSVPKKGYKLNDSVLGYATIIEVNEMIILGQVVGYRVRTD